MTKFNRGDVVTIRATVEYTADSDNEYVSVKAENSYNSFAVKSSAVTFVHGHFELGERVWVDDFYGYVRAVNGEMAWVQREGQSDFLTLPLRDLERAPLETQQQAAE